MAKRRPRKKGQHRSSPNHDDLYTDENKEGTIPGLKFATVKDAEASVRKIKRSGRSHNHKTQAAIAMEQRAKVAGKKSAAAVYRRFIEQQKEKTKKKNKKKKTNETVLRNYIRTVLLETNFPLEGEDKMRIHHSREGTRSGGEPQISGFSQKVGPKPNGLWYECQDGSADDWKQFCNTGFGDDNYYDKKYDSSYNVVLEDYNILFIPDVHHFRKFSTMYGVGTGFDKKIDWPKVAEHYAGIEICPYLWEMRNDDDSLWYYGWDVSSGCVWDPSGIKELIKSGECD